MAKRVKIPGRLESAETGGIVTGTEAVMDDEKGKTQVVINSEVDAAIISLAQGKQDALTFDNAPTEGSPNPVTSAGVYTADKVLSDAIEAILLLIPSAASALNKLVDMQTMNSSIATATASFKGTYNLVSDLHLGVDATHEQIGAALDALSLGADNNDYAFVQVPNSATAPTEISKTERYKYNGTNWLFEYDLNNSGFTQGQWNAINSGVTSLLVGKLSDLPTDAELTALLAGKQDNLTFDNVPTAGSPNPVKSGGVYARNNEIVALINALDAAKQDVLTFDNAPVEGSPNPVKSGGVYTAISAVQAAIVALDAEKQNVLTFDSTPTLGSANPVTSSGIKTELNRIDGNITTLNDLYEALTQSALVIVQPTDTWPVASPATSTIYRVVDRVNTPPQNYSDYIWNGSAMVLMATYDNAIDDEPTAGSNNLVKSGGVRNLTNDIIQSIVDCPYYDSSKYTALSSLSYPYEDNKLLNENGTTDNVQGFGIYTITHSNWSVYWQTIGIVGNFEGISNLSKGYANIEIKDADNKIVFRGTIQGYKMIILQRGWTLRLSIQTSTASTYFVQTSQASPQIEPPIKGIDGWPTKSSNAAATSNGTLSLINELRQSIIDSPYIDKTKFIPITEASTDITYEDNKLLQNDGTSISNNSFGIYTITFTNSSEYNRSKGIYALFDGLYSLSNEYANFELKDSSGNLIFRERLSGEKLIIMQPSWVLKLCVLKTSASKFLVQNVQGFQLYNLNGFIQNAGNALNKKIYGIGDSLTDEGTYLTELSTLTGIATKNLGVSGEDVPTIFGRINSLPYKVAADMTIPASNASEVEFSLTSDYGTVLPLLGGNACKVQIVGIIGTLRTEADSWATSATYFFKRDTSGNEVSVKAGEPLYCIDYGVGYQSKFGSVPSAQYQIIWVGQNGGYYIEDGVSITQDDANNLVSMLKGHIERTQPQNFIVVSPPKNTNTILESTLSKAFGGSFLNVRKQLVDNGIRVALDNGYLVGEYPTAQDTQDIQNGIIPTSLREDAVHLNVAGYKTFARLCYNNIIKYVWML